MLVPDLTFPLYGSIVGAVVREGRACQQLVITGNTGFDTTVEAELVAGFVDVGVDGLVVSGILDGEATARSCRAARVPVVWMHNNRNAVGARVVGADHVLAGRLATEHLLGHAAARSRSSVDSPRTTPPPATGTPSTSGTWAIGRPSAVPATSRPTSH